MDLFNSIHWSKPQQKIKNNKINNKTAHTLNTIEQIQKYFYSGSYNGQFAQVFQTFPQPNVSHVHCPGITYQAECL